MPPFKSSSQSALCFSLKAKGKAKGWDCKEFAKSTNYKGLPKRVSSKNKK